MRKSIIVATWFVFSLFCFFGVFEAEAQRGRCERYAREAVDQYEHNKYLGCGFEGRKWHSNYDKHLNWCRKVSREEVRAKQRARTEMLMKCEEKGSGCDDYARTAVQQNKINHEYGCGYDDRRWHSNYDKHYEWCTRVSRGEVELKSRERSQMINDCTGGGGGRCSRYARAAVRQNELNREQGCGFEGRKWHSNYQKHFDWCNRVPAKEASARLRTREQMLQECAYGGGGRWCEHYANTAVKQNERNRRRGCRYEGRKWHSDYDKHYEWCRKVSREEAESKISERQRKLDECSW